MTFLLLLITIAKRIYNALLTHFDLQLHLNNFFLPAGCNYSPLKEYRVQLRQKKEKHETHNNRAAHHFDCLRPLIKTSAASDHQSRRAYLPQMLPPIHFSLISSINAHHIISCYTIGLISPPYNWWEDKKQKETHQELLYFAFCVLRKTL